MQVVISPSGVPVSIATRPGSLPLTSGKLTPLHTPRFTVSVNMVLLDIRTHVRRTNMEARHREQINKCCQEKGLHHGQRPAYWRAQYEPEIWCMGASTCVTRRKLQTPGTAEEHKRQETPTTNPNDRQPAHLTDQASGTIERAAQESRRIPPTSTAAVHASSTVTTRHQYLHPTG